MAINDLPTPSDSNLGLLSYRGATSYLVLNEQRRNTRGESPCPLEPCEPKPEVSANQPPATERGTKANAKSTTLSRCRSRTPSPPHPSPSTQVSHKAPRSVSPGGTPATSARAALRRSGTRPQVVSPSPRLQVSWADSLVASVRTRPRTLRKDVSALFYSRADERRFRQEAATAVEDDEWCESLEEDSLTSLTDDEAEGGTAGHTGLWSPPRRRKDYAISKAVVVFGDATMTYDDAFVVGGCAVEASLEMDKVISFDDAAFWNGQLTWS